MYTLYYAPGTCALATNIALEEVGAEYQAIKLNFAAGEQHNPNDLKINPKGRAPAIVTDRVTLTETPALFALVAQHHSAARRAPLENAFVFARLQEFNMPMIATL